LLEGLIGSKIEKIELKGNEFIEKEPKYKEKLYNIFPMLYSIDREDKLGEIVNSTNYDEEDELLCGSEFDDSDEDEEELFALTANNNNSNNNNNNIHNQNNNESNTNNNDNNLDKEIQINLLYPHNEDES
jgi:hypothetical protein